MQFVRASRVKIFQEILPKITEKTLPNFEAYSGPCKSIFAHGVSR
jgi:hypothetical protein